MKTPDQKVATVYDEPHEVIGRFIVLCSTLEYRQSQLLSRWFTPGARLKFLSNVVHSIPAAQKREIIAERLSQHHPKGAELPALMDAIGSILARRELAVHGVFTAAPDGRYFLKNLAADPVHDGDEILDVLWIEEIPALSKEAARLTGEIVSLSKLRANA